MNRFTGYFLILTIFFCLSFAFSPLVSAQTTVVIPGSFQSEIGCTGDWMPDCDATRLTETSPGIWEATIYIPAGLWEYKVAHNNSWDENYGAGGEPGGANMVLGLGSPTFVHFTYSSSTHLVELTFMTSLVKLAGSFQSELGCPGDWMPDCEASGLFYDLNTNTWYGLFAIPPGNWEYKVTINNSWDENYGLGGVLNGPNIPLSVTSNKKTLFHYDPITHLVTTAEIDDAVTLAGSFQSELGCSGDWQPDCLLTGLSFDGAQNLWTGEMMIPAGAWEFKVALNGSWNENYGAGGVFNGPNIILTLSSTSRVFFTYNPDTHIISYTTEQMTVVLPGSFQSELGCAADWDPACDNTRLLYDASQQLWTGTFAIPAGYWEYKVAYNDSWNENYGAGGIQNGENIPLYLEAPANITFLYDPQTHLVTLVYNTTTLCATAFYDANANGYPDDDIPMEGVSFNLSGSSSATQTTGSDGKTCFSDLFPGEYTIEGMVPDSHLPTTATSQTMYLNEPFTFNLGLVCLGGAGAQDKGFWMNIKGKAVFDNLWNKDQILEFLQYMNLRNADGSSFHPATYEELQTWMKRANAINMSYMLSAQLAVLYLNVESGLVDGYRMVYTPGIGYTGVNLDFMEAYSLIWHTAYQLYLYPVARGGDEQRIELEKLKNLLEQVNQDVSFVQHQPCNNSMQYSARIQSAQANDQIQTNTATLLWPNPSAKYFTLRLTSPEEVSTALIRVMDITGRQVFVATEIIQSEVQFGESFKPGLYIVEISEGTNRTRLRIVKK